MINLNYTSIYMYYKDNNYTLPRESSFDIVPLIANPRKSNFGKILYMMDLLGIVVVILSL